MPPAPSTQITAASPQTPTALAPQPATPAFDTSGTLDAIRNFYQIPSNSFAAVSEGQGLAARGADEIQKNKIMDQYQREQSMQAQQQARENALRAHEASSYRLQPGANGGPSQLVNVYTGAKVNAMEFSQLTGASPDKVYGNSTNTRDQQFANAFNNYNGFMQALMNNDTKTLKTYYANNAGLQKMKPDQVRQLFMQQYGDYLGVPQANVPYGVNQQFSPNNDIITVGNASYKRGANGQLIKI